MRALIKILAVVPAALLISSLLTNTAEAASCIKKESNNSYWYECDGVKVTQSVNPSFYGNHILDFTQHGDRVTWVYRATSGNWTTASSESTYYTNKVTGGNYQSFTQTARGNFNDDQQFQDMQIVNGRAVWRFADGERNCGMACNLKVSYHYACLEDANNFKITDIAHSRFLQTQWIENFNMNWSANTATWDYYDGYNWYRNKSNYLGACSVPLVIPVAPASVSAAVNNGDDVTISWTLVTGASYYNREVSINSGAYQNSKRYDHPQSSVVFEGQQPRTYKYRIRACNTANQCSGWTESNAITVVPGTPSTPASVSASISNGDDITISWSLVDGASYYNREVSINSGAYQNIKRYEHPQSSIVFENQQPRTYRYRVRACNVVDQCSAWRSSNSVTVN